MPRLSKVRTEGRWRLDFSHKDRILKTPETQEQRRARIKAWLMSNYPQVMRDSAAPDDVPIGDK